MRGGGRREHADDDSGSHKAYRYAIRVEDGEEKAVEPGACLDLSVEERSVGGGGSSPAPLGREGEGGK